MRASKAAASNGSLVPRGTTGIAVCQYLLSLLNGMALCCRVRASKAAASDGSLVPRGTTGAAEGGYITVDEAEIRAEGVESALISVQRIVNLLAFNATKGITPALQVCFSSVKAWLSMTKQHYQSGSLQNA